MDQVRKKSNRRTKLLNKNTNRKFRTWISGYLFIAPNFIGFFIFSLAPIFATIFISLTDWDLNKMNFIGLQNYMDLFQKEEFWISLRQTLLFTFLNVPIQTAIALGIAMFLNKKLKGLNAFRTLFLVPWVVMAVAHGFTFQWLFNTSFGFFNHLVKFFGHEPVKWLGQPDNTFFVVLGVNIWMYLGYHIILLLAALQTVPKELKEAAVIDGASGWQRFIHITIPVISPILFYDIVINMIGTLQIFDLPFVLSPQIQTVQFLNFLIYRKAFNYWYMGSASANAVILFLIVAVLTLIVFKVLGSRVSYDQK